MQVIVRSGADSLVFDLESDATVRDLKAAVEDKQFLPAHLQRIVFCSETLTSGYLSDILGDDKEVYLEVGVDGGMRAKWRKKRMRRLRRKRRKMRMRARWASSHHLQGPAMVITM